MKLTHIMAMCQLDKVRALTPVMYVGLALGLTRLQIIKIITGGGYAFSATCGYQFSEVLKLCEW